MIPIDFGEKYGPQVIFGKDQTEFIPLPVNLDGEGGVFSIWDLTIEERMAILDGAKIGLRIMTMGQPLQPVYLAVEGTDGWPYAEVLDANSTDTNT